MSKAVKSLWSLSQDDVMREIQEALDKRRRDQVSWEEDAFERGEAKGERRGVLKGRAEGIEKGIKQVARNMLAAGAEPRFVAKTTGLALAEVEKLAKS